jgi:hypothetical protein
MVWPPYSWSDRTKAGKIAVILRSDSAEAPFDLQYQHYALSYFRIFREGELH